MSYNRLLAYVNRCYEEMAYIPSENEIETEIGWCLNLDDYDQFEKYVSTFIAINDMTGIDIHYNIKGLCPTAISPLENISRLLYHEGVEV